MALLEDKKLKIPCTNEIETFLHCVRCFKDKPIGETMKNWARLEVGYTNFGLQIWCLRHNCNVIHLDFEGQKFHVNLRWIDAV